MRWCGLTEDTDPTKSRQQYMATVGVAEIDDVAVEIGVDISATAMI